MDKRNSMPRGSAPLNTSCLMFNSKGRLLTSFLIWGLPGGSWLATKEQEAGLEKSSVWSTRTSLHFLLMWCSSHSVVGTLTYTCYWVGAASLWGTAVSFSCVYKSGNHMAGAGHVGLSHSIATLLIRLERHTKWLTHLLRTFPHTAEPCRITKQVAFDVCVWWGHCSFYAQAESCNSSISCCFL